MKKCTKCKVVKPLSEFHGHSPQPFGFLDGKVYWCKDCAKTYSGKHYKANAKKVCKRTIANRISCMDSWRSYFLNKTACECCGKPVKFASGDRRTSINFDHRSDGAEAIKGHPTAWLKVNRRTPKNEEIWESCDFGTLCFKCNISLPTNNRNEFVTKLMMYINLKRR